MHTKERWAVVDCAEYAEIVPQGKEEELIATVHRGFDMSYLDDATRIAACHNACLTMAEPEEDVKALIDGMDGLLSIIDLQAIATNRKHPMTSAEYYSANSLVERCSKLLARVQGGK